MKANAQNKGFKCLKPQEDKYQWQCFSSCSPTAGLQQGHCREITTMGGFVLFLQQAEPCLCCFCLTVQELVATRALEVAARAAGACFFSHDITGKEDSDSFQRCAVKISTPQREKVVVVQYRVPVPSIVVGFPPVRMFRCDGQDPKLQSDQTDDVCMSPSCQDRNQERAQSALEGRIIGQPRLERTSKDHLDKPCVGKGVWVRRSCALSSGVLKISSNEDSTISLGRLFCRMVVLTVKTVLVMSRRNLGVHVCVIRSECDGCTYLQTDTCRG